MGVKTEVAIIGGGLAGLTAAAYLARAGKRVVVFEKNQRLGGRADTQAIQGFRFNLGPHALYRGGAAAIAFKELGLKYSGRAVPANTYLAVRGGKTYKLPAGPLSLLRTGLLSARGKLEMLRFLASLSNLDTAPLDFTSERVWLDRQFRSEDARQFMEALIRLTTYTNDPEKMSIGAALSQMKLAVTHGVDYLDDGWSTLVEGLRSLAESHGAEIRTGVRITSTEGIADSVIFAGGPRQALEQKLPVTMATLDLALEKLPEPANLFALGIDSPLYFSVHSRWARLAPEGKAMIHVGKYGPGTQDELEAMLDLVQPGWRDQVIHSRFMPRLVVSNAMVTAKDGGLRGRTAVDRSGQPNVFFAGDWVGETGMLADASVASGKKAAELIVKMRKSICELQFA